MKELASEAGQISGTMILLIVFCIGWMIERIYKLRGKPKNGVPTWHSINKELDKKMTEERCVEFKTRIGEESVEHRKNINHIKDDMSEIKSGVSYIKGKIG